LPFVTQQAKADAVVIVLTAKVLISQCAFLLEIQGLMKVDRAPIKRRSHLTLVPVEMTLQTGNGYSGNHSLSGDNGLPLNPQA
jgi:hypothetical protein